MSVVVPRVLPPTGVSRQTAGHKLFRLSLAHFIADGAAGFMLPILPFMAHSLGFGLAASGWLLGASSVTSSLLQPLYGILADKYRRFNYLLAGLIIAVLCLSLIGLSSNYWTLFALITVGYFGVGLLHPRAFTYTHSLGGLKPNVTMSIFIIAGTTGFALGPMLASWLVNDGGLPATTWALLALIPVLPLMLGIDRQFVKTLGLSSQRRQAGERLNSAEARLLALLCSVALVRAILMVGLKTFMPFVWQAQGHSLLEIGGVLGVSALVAAPLALLGSYLGDRYGERKILWASFVPSLMLLPMMLQTSGLLGFGLFIMTNALMEMSLTPNTVLALRSIPKNRNLVSGFVAGFVFGTAGLLMPLLGSAGETYGLQTALMSLSVPLAIGCVLIAVIPKRLFEKSAINHNQQLELVTETALETLEPVCPSASAVSVS